MPVREKLLHFQNKAEKEFYHKKNLQTSLFYFLALIVFMSSTIVAGFTLPVRSLFKLFKKKNQAIIHMNKGNMNDILKKEKIVLIDFWAEWCGPCLMMEPALEKFSKESNGICIAKVNADLNPKIVKQFNVRGLPQFLLLQNGKEIKRHAGPMTYSELKTFCLD